MTVGATLVASLLVSLARPATWPLALATFLLRGGFVLVLAPIIVLPSAVALGNLLTPLVSTFVFRGFGAVAAPVIGLAVVALVWLVSGGLLAAAIETELVRRVAADDDAWSTAPAPRARSVGAPPIATPVWRVLTVRLLAQLPLFLGLSWGAIRIVTVAYRELTVPTDVTVALVIRVVSGAPDAVAVVVVTWLIGEVVGAIAARRVILLGEPVPTALVRGAGRVLRRPVRCLALAVLPLVPMALSVSLVGFATSATWDALRAGLSFGGSAVLSVALLLVLVGLFVGGLLLIGTASAWRAAVWTVDVAGTFGVAGHDPEGPWNGVTGSATLSDLRPRGVDPDPR